MALLCHMLTSSFFIFGGHFCEHADGVVIRLLRSTVQELLHVEDMRKALGQATHKPPAGFVTWRMHV